MSNSKIDLTSILHYLDNIPINLPDKSPLNSVNSNEIINENPDPFKYNISNEDIIMPNENNIMDTLEGTPKAPIKTLDHIEINNSQLTNNKNEFLDNPKKKKKNFLYRKRIRNKIKEKEKPNKKCLKKIITKNKAKKKAKHDKFCKDNINKRLKKYFFDKALNFLNSIINSFLNEKRDFYLEKIELKYSIKKNRKKKHKDLIKKLNYAIISDLGKDNNLNLFDMDLGTIFSQPISPKYKNLKPEWNEKMIDLITKTEKDNKIITFAFKLKFREFYYLLVHKKELRDIENVNEEIIKKLKEKLVIADKLKDLDDKDGNLLRSNENKFEEFFVNKQGRNRKNTKNEKLKSKILKK